MKTETFKKGFTLVEILTTIVIITILIGVLLPALNMARNFAKGAKQGSVINSLDIGINMFKNDTGEYPPSHGKGTGATPPGSNDYSYCGAQTLAEAMVGCDLMGFHPKSVFDETKNYAGYPNFNSSSLYYDDTAGDSLKARKDLYVDRTNLGVFDTNDVYGDSGSAISKGYMICDSFDGTGRTKTVGKKKVKIGTPILYYRADTSKLDIDVNVAPKNDYDKIYDYGDNALLVNIGTVKDTNTKHTNFNSDKLFYNYIKDEQASATRIMPVKPDSFLLISAGQDGVYGTTDDICNFEKNTQ